MSVYQLYDIKARIRALIDEETGEVSDADLDALMNLNEERTDTIEGIALLIKEQKAWEAAIKIEQKAIAERLRTIVNTYERLSDRLLECLGDGEKLKTARVTVSVLNSSPLELDNDFVAWAMANDDSLLRYKDPEPDKNAIKELIKQGEEVPHATLVTRRNLQIK